MSGLNLRIHESFEADAQFLESLVGKVLTFNYRAALRDEDGKVRIERQVISVERIVRRSGRWCLVGMDLRNQVTVCVPWRDCDGLAFVDQSPTHACYWVKGEGDDAKLCQVLLPAVDEVIAEIVADAANRFLTHMGSDRYIEVWPAGMPCTEAADVA